MTWQAFLVLTLASYRLWRLLAYDDVLDRPRKWLWGRLGSVDSKRRADWVTMVQCPWCLGFWITLAWFTAWWTWHPLIYPSVPLAASTLVGLIVTAKLDP